MAGCVLCAGELPKEAPSCSLHSSWRPEHKHFKVIRKAILDGIIVYSMASRVQFLGMESLAAPFDGRMIWGNCLTSVSASFWKNESNEVLWRLDGPVG